MALLQQCFCSANIAVGDLERVEFVAHECLDALAVDGRLRDVCERGERCLVGLGELWEGVGVDAEAVDARRLFHGAEEGGG